MAERTPEADAATRLIGLVDELVRELHPARTFQVTLDKDLDRDLHFDSLARAELLLRLERVFEVALPEQLLATAETPRDLLRAVATAQPASARRRPVGVGAPTGPAMESVGSVPDTAETLVDVVAWHVDRQPDRPHVHLYESGDAAPAILSYGDLDRSSRAVAAALVARGLVPGQSVAIMLPTSCEYLATFLGIVMAGGVPVPIYPPARPSQLEDHLRRHARILEAAQTRHLVTIAEAQTAARLLRGQVDCLRDVLTRDDLAGDAASFAPPPIKASDTAFVQFTSGSTGQPKGVVLTHQNILANIRAMGEAIRASSDDVFVSWLPLYHDMGLIGAWLGSLYYAMQSVLMSPLSFLANPARWLWAIHEHGGTISAAPNFAFELCLSKIPDGALEGLDLATWRRAFNGAEPVSPRTVRRFSERYAAFGFRAGAMAPVYGLAEVAVGLAFPPLDSGASIDRIQRAPFERGGRAEPAGEDDAAALEFVACGRPLPGYEIRIVGPTGVELGEREEGRLEFRGPSATSGYLRNPEASEALFDGDWLDSGDLAYIAGADVYPTSRVKDVIIRGGRNIYPYEVEEAVGDLDGVRKGCVAVFGSADPASGTEKLVVMAETREEAPGARERLAAQIDVLVNDVLGMPADDVALVPPRTVLKTSSGKIRRAASREIYERGEIGKRARSVWWQVTRLVLSSAASRWRRTRRVLAEVGYGVYVEALFFALVVPVWIGTAVLPWRARWALIRAGARTLFRAARIPFLVDGLDRLPGKAGRIYVANHSSYLDGVVVVAGIPDTFSFAAKAELEQRFVSRVFLRRIGARFVERTDVERGLADARMEIRAAQEGESLFFFPEGGLTREPGLRPFHLGAFAAAAQAGVPVVPVTIRGSRSILRDGSWFPRRGPLTLVVAEPVYPDGDDWSAAVRLRDASRARMLEHLGEPDMAAD